MGQDGSLIGRASRALGWSLLGTAFGRLSTLAIGIALARVLGPREFGTFAAAQVVLLAVLSVNELGVSLAIVRWPGDPKEIAPTVATLSVAASAVCYLGCFLAAPVAAHALGSPHATGVIRVLSLNVLLDGALAVPVALLQRQFRQDRKMAADLTTGWVGALTSIGLAVGGFGAMSLALGQVAGALAGGALLATFARAGLRLGFDRAKAAALLRFGTPLAGSSLVVFAVSNVDRLAVGAVAGPAALGFYALAANLANAPVNLFSQPVRAVAPAALARLQHDPGGIRTAFLSTVGLLAAVTLPACVLLAAAAGPGVHLLYGPAWAGAARILPWLALLGALRVFFELGYDYFVVIARTRAVLAIQLAWLACVAPAVYLATRAGGAVGVAVAGLGVAVLVVLPLYLRQLHRVGIGVAPLARRAAGPVLAALGVAAAVLLVHRLVPVDLVALVLAGGGGLAAIAVSTYRMRPALRALRAIEPSAITPSPAPEVAA